MTREGMIRESVSYRAVHGLGSHIAESARFSYFKGLAVSFMAEASRIWRNSESRAMSMTAIAFYRKAFASIPGSTAMSYVVLTVKNSITARLLRMRL